VELPSIGTAKFMLL